jgi:putative hydrolase of HD superfamily
MQTKASIPVAHLRKVQVSPFIVAYFEFSHLKQLYRQDWLRRGITPARCESVADHSFGVAMLSMLLADAYFPYLDHDKVVRMALLHDLGEVYAGDVIPRDAVSPREKHRRERLSVAQVLHKLPNGEAYVMLWQEYERASSPEARFVRQVDRLEMGLQASVYEHQGLGALSEFFISVDQALSAPVLRALLAELEALRGRLAGL